MLRLDKVVKPWKESGLLNAHINLYGFWNETTFLTKSGDVGMVLSVPGVDYESLDRSEQAYAVKRLEAALKAFGPGFHVYQYLFKSNRPDIPFAKYNDPIVDAAVDQRRKFFEAKREHLYQIEIFYSQIPLDAQEFVNAQLPWHKAVLDRPPHSFWCSRRQRLPCGF
jgi:type IV secretory pathway VirB4 component